MGFSNPIVGGETLIRRAIKSPDFVTNVSGWSINRDGTAEFLEAIIRGTISIAGGIVQITNVGIEVIDSNSRYVINTGAGFKGNPIPDDGSFIAQQLVATFYQPATPYNGFTVLPGYVAQNNSANFFTNIELTSPAINSQKRGHIKVWGASSSGASLPTFDFGVLNGTNLGIKKIRMETDCDIEDFAGNERYGRGRVAFVSDSGNINLTTTAAVAFVIPSTTYKAGRAYEARMYARYVDGDSPSVFLRKGSTTGGAVVVDAGRVPLPINNTLTFETPMPFIVGGSDVTTDLNVTMTSLGTTTQVGPRKVEIWDIGPASLYADFSANTLS